MAHEAAIRFVECSFTGTTNGKTRAIAISSSMESRALEGWWVE